MLGCRLRELEGICRQGDVIDQAAQDRANLFQWIFEQCVEKLRRGEILQYSMVKRYMRKDGGIIRINLKGAAIRDEAGRTVSYLGMIEHITEQKRAQQASQASEQRYSTLLETMNEGCGIANENGIITYVNAKRAQVLGYSKEELAGPHAGDTYAGPLIFKQAFALRERCESATFSPEFAMKSSFSLFDSRSPIIHISAGHAARSRFG